MKYLQAILFGLAAAAILTVVCRLAIPKTGKSLTRGLVLVPTLLVGFLAVVLTPSETGTQWGIREPMGLQFIDLPETDAFAYERGLVATPRGLPLPALAGQVVAKYSRSTRLTAEWQGNALVVSARGEDGFPAKIQCGASRIGGYAIEYSHPQPVPACAG
ncbi:MULTISPECIES: hypothetical protein [unclassified Variovorax]|uniref:hypothetical protein n=1 Tax=unclassified Variovorax TaxID=663243 RepID=UPI000839A37F|nr:MULTISPECIES: hypothetical protein [unclassified Variovorax]PNG50326.1 hypothetical protein CHC06_05949 [Variovorax sp. B2]PNG51199.1 hypothetical protein CHC07_05855 [Variovorax sp. B4]VTV17422.1 hypothetical protein WDL1P1_00376 [Variovorax sp. WDL1]